MSRADEGAPRTAAAHDLLQTACTKQEFTHRAGSVARPLDGRLSLNQTQCGSGCARTTRAPGCLARRSRARLVRPQCIRIAAEGVNRSGDTAYRRDPRRTARGADAAG